MAKANPKKLPKSKTSKTFVKAATVGKTGNGSFRSDVKQSATLMKVGRTGAANAIRATKALGLPIIYLQNGVLYKEYPDGTKEKMVTNAVKRPLTKKASHPLKKGMIFHAKK